MMAPPLPPSGMGGSQAAASPLVGILGGMGPAATADFYTKLILHTPAERDQDHLRVAMWADPTVPDRVGAALGRGADPYPVILAGARRLAVLGVTTVAMPCNTAHLYFDRLVHDTGLSFVHMVHETVAEVVGLGDVGRAVGLLGTRVTLRSDLYQAPLSDAGIEVVLPTEDGQLLVDSAIAAVKSGDTKDATVSAEGALRSLTDRGLHAIILACTELPLVMRTDTVTSSWCVVDPTDVLARATVRESRRPTDG